MNNTLDINPVRPAQLTELARATFAADRFLYVEGAGGIGKTSILCHEVAATLGLEVWLVNLSGQGPQEVIGYGIPNAETGDMRFAAPDIWPTLKRVGDRGVLLILDELNDYDPAVRALLRGLFPASGARYVGPHRLGDNVHIAVTGNRRSDGVRASKIEDAPFTERSVKVTLVANLGDWLDWVDTQPRLTDSGSHVPAFLKFGSTTGDGLDHFNPPIANPYDGVPHPCPRTYEAVMLMEGNRKQDPALFNILLRGSVGDRAASAYLGFLSLVDRLPDIALLKTNPDAFALPTDPSEQYALVSACLATCTRGVKDVAIAVHSGGFDWLVTLLLKVRGDIREWGARSAVRRGIPLDEHPRSHDLIVG